MYEKRNINRRAGTIRRFMISIILVAGMVLIAASDTFAQTVTDDQIKKGIIELVSGISFDGKFYPENYSTGFIVSKTDNGFYAVASYNAVICSEEDVKSFCKENDLEDNSYNVQAEYHVIVDGHISDETVDIIKERQKDEYCIIQIPANILDEREALRLGSAARLHSKDTVKAFGFPKNDQDRSELKYGTADVQKIESEYEGSSPDGKFLGHDIYLDEGTTGGPLVDSEGYVVGMNTIYSNYSGTNGFALSVTVIRELLDESSIPYYSIEIDETRKALADKINQIKELTGSGRYNTKSYETLVNTIIPEAEKLLETHDYELKAEDLQSEINKIEDAELLLEEKLPVQKILMIPFAAAIVILAVRLVALLASINKMKKEKTELPGKTGMEIPVSNKTPDKMQNGNDAGSARRRQGGFSLTIKSTGYTQYFDNITDVSLGRMRGQVDFCINNRSVGRFHAYIRNQNGNYYIYDNSSVNGTFINGTPVKESGFALMDGDVIILAEEEIIFHTSV